MVRVGAAVIAGSVALLGFDSGTEALASIIVIWRFTGTRLTSATSEHRAQRLVAVSFCLLAPYIAIEASRAMASGDRTRPATSGTRAPAPPPQPTGPPQPATARGRLPSRRRAAPPSRRHPLRRGTAAIPARSWQTSGSRASIVRP